MKKVEKIAADISALMMVIAAFACAAAFGGENEIAKWDSRMALKDAVVTNGVKWIDGRSPSSSTAPRSRTAAAARVRDSRS